MIGVSGFTKEEIMKKGIILVIMLVLTLSGCDDSLKYTSTDIVLDGNEVYTLETKTDVCITLYSTTIDLSKDMKYEIRYNCEVQTFVLLDDEYIPLITYIKNNLKSIDNLLDSGLGRPIYYNSIRAILDIDVNNFVLDKITIRTLNGEFIDYGGAWTEDVELEIEFEEIATYILVLMSSKVENNQVCDNIMCILVGNISPVSIYLRNGNDELIINFYGDRYMVSYTDDNANIRIYNIAISPENEDLKNTVMEVFSNLD